MIDEQDQRVGSGGQAIQAGRDVIVQKGLSADEMTAIMVAMAKELSTYQADALRTVDKRLQEFREEILSSFTRADNQSNREAFRDPDFQYLLADAQKAYARSGDLAVRGTLVDIIKRRSLETTRNRMAVTLDDAATKAPALTINEFSELSLGYVARHTVNHSVNSFATFCNYIATQLMPFVPNITKEASSYWHIESQSCGSIEMGQIDLLSIFRNSYTGVLGKGFDRQTLENHLPDGKKNAVDNFIVPCLQDASKLQPSAMRKSVFLELTGQAGLDSELTTNVWNAFEATVPPKTELIDLIRPHVPDIESLFTAWDETPMKHLKLTSVGLAIGHANAVRVTGFDAPLSIWIK
jgi:hypothetical protein